MEIPKIIDARLLKLHTIYKSWMWDNSNRNFYTLPDDYMSKSAPWHSDNLSKNEKNVLLAEIYNNIASRSARFDGPFGWRSVLYCDYAASGQPLKFIEDYIADNVLPYYGNTHTTITATSCQTTFFRHEARDMIRKAVNANEHDAVLFTGNGSTSAINLLIHTMSLTSECIVFIGPYEHNSNVLPWRELQAKIVRIKENNEGLVDIDHLESELKLYHNLGIPLIGAFSAASNVTGILVDHSEITILLHRYGALAFWDYAAAGPYENINMNQIVLGKNEGLAHKDAIFLSPHKFIGGPQTPGILVAKKKLFVNPVPNEPGGGTIFFVTRAGHRYLKEIEDREEGGTPSIIGSIRAGMAFQLKEAVGTQTIEEVEFDICQLVLSKWKHIPQLHILGSLSVPRLPFFSFVIFHEQSGLYLHHNFVCTLLNDLFGIQTRSGCACAGAYALDLLGIDEDLAKKFDDILAENSDLDRTHLRRKGEYSDREILRPGFVRLSIPFFMPEAEVKFITVAVGMIAMYGWKLLPQYNFNPETGEWTNKGQKTFLSRKWLGSISYNTGKFSVKQETVDNVNIPGFDDMLNHATHLFENAVSHASKIFTPDQHLIFDDETSRLRWFLLPSEAKQYMLGQITKPIQNPVFCVRKQTKTSDLDIQNANTASELRDLPTIDDKNFNTEKDLSLNLPIEELSLETDAESHEVKPSDSIQATAPGPSNCPLWEPSKWHAPPNEIFKPFLQAVNYFQMIKDKDRVLVCVSGGKDSLSLLHTLRQYQHYASRKEVYFELGAMTVDPKSPLYDPSPLVNYMQSLSIPYYFEEQDIVGQAAALGKCKSICSFCSRLRRGRIYSCARKNGYNVIALGQHLDDLSESFLMSVFHNGRLRTMKAHYFESSTSLRIVRPFVFVREKDLRQFAEKKKLPIIAENCPACFEAPKERHRIKQLLANQEVQFPNLYRSLRSSLYPLMAINVTGLEDKLLGKPAGISYDPKDCPCEDSDD